jgi:hypothetical protein
LELLIAGGSKMAYTVMSNQSEHDKKEAHLENIDKKDIDRLRELAKQWMEIASGDEMKERKKGWKALHGLKPIRPMILFETFSVSGFVTEEELSCENKLLKNIERTMVYSIKQYRQLGDDIVLEPYFRLSWKVLKSDHGVKIVEHHAEDSLAYLSNFPIHTQDDIGKLKERTFTVDKKTSLEIKEKIEYIFGDILPVHIGNYDNFFPELGFTPFTGTNFIGLTMDIFKLIGTENMLLWPYDCPDQIHRIMRYLCDDRIRFFKWMKQEGLLDFNTDNQCSCPSSYGYVLDLPEAGDKKTVELKDTWVWCESQETSTVSPQMFNEFYLPYLAEVANMFGLSYYGCCEPVDDRIEYIKKALPNLRTVSISGWNNFQKIGEALGKDYVHCKKPNPTFMSGINPDWDNMKKDLQDSFSACPGGNMEIVVRDVYDINGDMKRLAEWVKMAKMVVGI